MTETTFSKSECNRCGKTKIGTREELGYCSVEVEKFGDNAPPVNRMDLCPKCAERLQKFLSLSGRRRRKIGVISN